MQIQIQVYKIFFLISFISFIIPKTFAVNRIWLLRHCDKPKSEADPCCSKLGYERASLWHLYFEKYIQKKDKVKIYSSNFNEKNICINNIKYIPDSTCQKSQRMFLTAYYLHNTFKYDIIDLIPNYCIGEKDKLLSVILKDNVVTNAIVVWEHKEIIEIIRSFNIKIKKWKNKFNNIYNLVFMIDVQRKQLFYDCYDFDKNLITNCYEINDSEKWLSNFDTIDNYINNYSNVFYTSTQYPTNYEIKINYIKLVFFTVFFLFFLICLINIIIQRIIYQSRRREYTVII